MELNREQAMDILDRFDFFQGQRAGRELWNDKPFEIQERDIAKFSQDVNLLKTYIKELTQAHDMLSESYDHLEKTKDELLAERSRLIEKCQEAEKINKEKCNLEYTLLGVMHSVDKWLDGKELEQDEVNRAATMREKTLQIVEKLTKENERLQKALNTDISIVRVSRGSGKTAHLREVGRIKVDAIRADTVRKMQERLAKRFKSDPNLVYSNYNIHRYIDQIAKEMLEGL